MLETTWDRIAALRLQRQHLAQPAPKRRMLETVRDLVAVQAQVMSSAELSIGIRVDGLTRDDVRNALWTKRTLVKTWAMRGTLHLVAAEELPELAAALGNRTGYLRPVWLRYFGVTAAEMQRLQDAIGETLSAEPMTRVALAEALASQLGDPSFAGKVTGSWGTFLKPAANRGLLCFGPDDGRNVTFVQPAAWLGITIPEPDDKALQAIVMRHLAAFPGSSANELGRWWGGNVRPAIRALGDALTAITVDGINAVVRTEDLDAVANAEPATGIRLLGGFDPYTLSLQKEAEPLLPLARRPLVSRTAGWISAVVIDGGRVIGTWTHEPLAKRDAVAFEVSPWRTLTRSDRQAIDAEAARIADYLVPGSTPKVAYADPV
jgi:hypothetical protein